MIDTIGRAQDLAASGDREGARALYDAFWAEAARAGDQYQACVVAHFLAHAHIEPEAQLDWHLRALQGANAVGNERVRAFYPSLHANLGDVYLRLGNLTRSTSTRHARPSRSCRTTATDAWSGR
jgi:hypothetical protein